MPVLFKAKTVDGYSIKILSELIQHNLKTACFTINKEGISLRMYDPNLRILIDLNLESDKFNLYKFRAKETLYLGINLSHFHKMMKTIKKKDALILLIDSARPNELVIKVIPKENKNRTTTSTVKIQETQNIESDLPEGYSRCVNLISNDFQKACKEMQNISNNVKVTSKGFYIEFYCNGGQIYSRSVRFGETDESDADTDTEEGEEEDHYEQNFETDQLVRITKIAGLATNMQIFPRHGRPLLFKSQVGDLGKISIYLKSKELMEKQESDDE